MTKGYIYFSLHNFDGARAAYQEALSLNPQSVEVIIKLAQINESNKNIGEAQKLYTKALKLNPGNHDAIIGYLRIKKIYKEYDYVFNKATELLKYARDKDFIVSLEEILATEYGRRKDYDNAKKMYKNILKEQPNRIASLVGLADILLKNLYKNLLQEGNSLTSLLEEPEKLALSALSLDPDFIYTYLVLLDIERLRNDSAQEKIYEQKAKELLKSQKFLAAERDLIESRLKSLPQAKISITKK